MDDVPENAAEREFDFMILACCFVHVCLLLEFRRLACRLVAGWSEFGSFSGGFSGGERNLCVARVCLVVEFE